MVGVAEVTVDRQGRLTVPTTFRSAFAERRAPFDVVFGLLGRGQATVHAADMWPSPDEKASFERALRLGDAVNPQRLSSRDLRTVQTFLRLAACRYLDGEIQRGWRIRLPAPVRAWLDLPPVGKARDEAPEPQDTQVVDSFDNVPTERGQKGKNALGQIIVVGNLGALELWTRSAWASGVAVQSDLLDELATQTVQVLTHAVNIDQPKR